MGWPQSHPGFQLPQLLGISSLLVPTASPSPPPRGELVGARC